MPGDVRVDLAPVIRLAGRRASATAVVSAAAATQRGVMSKSCGLCALEAGDDRPPARPPARARSTRRASMPANARPPERPSSVNGSPACVPLKADRVRPASVRAAPSSTAASRRPSRPSSQQHDPSPAAARLLRASRCASAISSSVVLPIAETTTATRSPAAARAATRRATCRRRSIDPTDVPPYFCTTVVASVTAPAPRPRRWQS